MNSEALARDQIRLRPPTLRDGMAVHRLIAESPPLDTNSAYCNFLQCSHFAATSIVAEFEGGLVGSVSAYRLSERPDTLFVWQVAIAERARGAGLAKNMLKAILERESCRDVNFIETTISPDNEASWALFRRLAKELSSSIASEVWLDRDLHFENEHETEVLVTIGPVKESKQ